jgi:hypothetical protein
MLSVSRPYQTHSYPLTLILYFCSENGKYSLLCFVFHLFKRSTAVQLATLDKLSLLATFIPVCTLPRPQHYYMLTKTMMQR